MNWLTEQLTPIAKVRRNVVLLSALACLLAFFPVQTDQIGFFGARFTSDVVAFGLFHALLFYTLVMTVRWYFHWRLTGFDARLSQSDWRTRREEIKLKYEQAEDRRQKLARERREIANVLLASATKDRERLLDRQAELMRSSRFEDDISMPEIGGLKRQIDACQDEIDRAKEILNQSDEDNEDLARDIQNLENAGPLVSLVSKYVFLGEYFFPIALGFIASNLLLATQEFPMLWELEVKNR